MKPKSILMSALISLIFVSSSISNSSAFNNEEGNRSESCFFHRFPKIHFKFGTRSSPTCDDCCTGDKGICIIIDIEPPAGIVTDPGQGIGAFQVLSSTTMSIDMVQDNAPMPNKTIFYVTEDIHLSPSAARSLGFNSITIKKGNYPIDYSRNKLGFIVVNIVTS